MDNRKSWSNQYTHHYKNSDLTPEDHMLKETEEMVPEFSNAAEIYEYLHKMRTPKITDDILKDIPRTESTNTALNDTE